MASVTKSENWISSTGFIPVNAAPTAAPARPSSLIGCNALVELPADATEIAPNSVMNAILLEAV